MLEYKEIDIELKENIEWFEKYKYDIPIVHFSNQNNELIHVFYHKINENILNEIISKSINSTEKLEWFLVDKYIINLIVFNHALIYIYINLMRLFSESFEM